MFLSSHEIYKYRRIKIRKIKWKKSFSSALSIAYILLVSFSPSIFLLITDSSLFLLGIMACGRNEYIVTLVVAVIREKSNQKGFRQEGENKEKKKKIIIRKEKKIINFSYLIQPLQDLKMIEKNFSEKKLKIINSFFFFFSL